MKRHQIIIIIIIFWLCASCSLGRRTPYGRRTHKIVLRKNYDFTSNRWESNLRMWRMELVAFFDGLHVLWVVSTLYTHQKCSSKDVNRNLTMMIHYSTLNAQRSTRHITTQDVKYDFSLIIFNWLWSFRCEAYVLTGNENNLSMFLCMPMTTSTLYR